MHESITMLAGNVATEPRHLETDSGVHITSFRLASTPRRFKDGSYVDLDTSYVTVTCWRFAAQNAAASIRKGDPVLVMGALRVREWEREGRTGVTTEIDAKAIGHDLSRGVSRFTKVVRTRSVGSEEDEAFLARIDEGGDDAHRDSAHREGEGPDDSVDLRTGEIHQAGRPGGEHAPNGESRKVRQQREAATSAA